MVIESTQRDGELEQQPSSSKLSLFNLCIFSSDRRENNTWHIVMASCHGRKQEKNGALFTVAKQHDKDITSHRHWIEGNYSNHMIMWSIVSVEYMNWYMPISSVAECELNKQIIYIQYWNKFITSPIFKKSA